MFKSHGYILFDFSLSGRLSFSCSELVREAFGNLKERSMFAETIFMQKERITISLNNKSGFKKVKTS